MLISRTVCTFHNFRKILVHSIQTNVVSFLAIYPSELYQHAKMGFWILKSFCCCLIARMEILSKIYTYFIVFAIIVLLFDKYCCLVRLETHFKYDVVVIYIRHECICFSWPVSVIEMKHGITKRTNIKAMRK